MTNSSCLLFITYCKIYTCNSMVKGEIHIFWREDGKLIFHRNTVPVEDCCSASIWLRVGKMGWYYLFEPRIRRRASVSGPGLRALPVLGAALSRARVRPHSCAVHAAHILPANSVQSIPFKSLPRSPDHLYRSRGTKVSSYFLLRPLEFWGGPVKL